jgi:HEAT repeat protein
MASNPAIQRRIANWREVPPSGPFDPVDVRFQAAAVHPNYVPLIQPKLPINRYGLREISQRVLGIDVMERWVEDNAAKGIPSATYTSLEACLRGARFPCSPLREASRRYPDLRDIVWNQQEAQAVAEKYLLHWQRMLSAEPYLALSAGPGTTSLPELPSEDVNVAAVLGLLELPDTLAALRTGLTAPSGLLRDQAAHGLAHTMPGRNTENSLLEHAHDVLPTVRATIAHSLGQVGSEQSLGILLPLLRDESPRVQQAAIDGLVLLGLPQARDPIRSLVLAHAQAKAADEADLVRMSAILALRTFWAEEDVALLQQLALHDPSATVRSASIFVLGREQQRSAIGDLRRALLDVSPLVRGTAAHALASLDDEVSIPHIAESARSSVPHYVDPLSGQYESESTMAIDSLVELAHRGHLNARTALEKLELDIKSLGLEEP